MITTVLLEPLDPDAPEARRWLQDELAKPEYRSAQPTPFDLAMQQVRDWFVSLFEGVTGVPAPLLVLLLVVVVALVVVIGLLVFGLPRLRRRRRPAPLFDDHDRRDLTALRTAAATAAESGDWPLAIEERFRAIVRGVVDRDLVRVHPGTTAHGVAEGASHPFPEHAASLRSAAEAFDAVRYLGRTGSRARYEELVGLDLALTAATPATEPDAVMAAPR